MRSFSMGSCAASVRNLLGLAALTLLAPAALPVLAERRYSGRHSGSHGWDGKGGEESLRYIQHFKDAASTYEDGGSWTEYAVDALGEHGQAVGIMSVTPCHYMVPGYSVVGPQLMYIAAGEGYVSLADEQWRPLRPSPFRVGQGDIVALPPGYLHVVGNRHKARNLTFVVLHLSHALSHFSHIGAQAGVLSGFSKELLSVAFNVDEERLTKLMNSTSDYFIARYKHCDRDEPGPPEDWPWLEDSMDSDLTGQADPAADDVAARDEPSAQQNAGGENKHRKGALKYVFNLEGFDFTLSEKGGWLITADKKDWKGLKRAGIRGEVVRGFIKPGAAVVPHVHLDSDAAGIVLSGQGTLQVVAPDGRRLVDEYMSAGTVFSVPRGHPHAFYVDSSENEPMNLLGINSGSSRPMTGLFAGRGSLYRQLPTRLLASMFNITRDEAEELFFSQNEEGIVYTHHQDPKSRRHRPVDVA